MDCPLCNTELYVWMANLVSCRGTERSARHKFYVKWNDNVSLGDANDRVLELAVAADDRPVGGKWPIPNDATFPSQ